MSKTRQFNGFFCSPCPAVEILIYKKKLFSKASIGKDCHKQVVENVEYLYADLKSFNFNPGVLSIGLYYMASSVSGQDESN